MARSLRRNKPPMAGSGVVVVVVVVILVAAAAALFPTTTTSPPPMVEAWMVSPTASSMKRSWRTTYVSSTALRETSSSSASVGSTSSKAAYRLDGQEIRGPVTPVGNIVLVKVKETLTATGGGILLPDQAKERPTEGLVIAAGPGKLHPFTGVRIPNPISEGSSVLYGKFDGRAVEYNDDECQVIRDDDVLLMYDGVTMTLDNVVPVRDYVLVEVDDSSRKKDTVATASGVVVAAQVLASQGGACEGRVVKVGEGRMASDGRLTPSPVQIGDYVKYKDYAGNDVLIEGKSYSVVKMVDILSTLNEQEEGQGTA